jgi:hypothetical protein
MRKFDSEMLSNLFQVTQLVIYGRRVLIKICHIPNFMYLLLGYVN